MHEQPTPETDALFRDGHRQNFIQLARKLERERDEAREQRDRLVEALQKVVTAWDFAEWLDENDFESFRAALQSLTTKENL